MMLPMPPTISTPLIVLPEDSNDYEILVLNDFAESSMKPNMIQSPEDISWDAVSEVFFYLDLGVSDYQAELHQQALDRHIKVTYEVLQDYPESLVRKPLLDVLSNHFTLDDSIKGMSQTLGMDLWENVLGCFED